MKGDLLFVLSVFVFNLNELTYHFKACWLWPYCHTIIKCQQNAQTNCWTI